MVALVPYGDMEHRQKDQESAAEANHIQIILWSNQPEFKLQTKEALHMTGINILLLTLSV